MATIKKSRSMCWQECREKDTLVHCWWEWKLVHYEKSKEVPQTTKNRTTIRFSNSSPGYLSEENKSEVKWSEVTQLCLTLRDPMDYSLLGSSHGIFQARVLEWGAISFSRGASPLRDRTQVSRIVGRNFTIWAAREVLRNIKSLTKKYRLYHVHRNITYNKIWK